MLPLAIATLVHWNKKLPLCASSCRPLLCTQAVEERFDELVEDALTPTPIGAEGSWQVLDATGSAQVTILCILCLKLVVGLRASDQ